MKQVDTDESVSVFHQSSNELLDSYKTTYYFDQLIDHSDPSKGTFKQRYWHNYEFYETGALNSAPTVLESSDSFSQAVPLSL